MSDHCQAYDIRPSSDIAALVTPPYDVISPEASGTLLRAASARTSSAWSWGAMSRATTSSTTAIPAPPQTFAEWRLRGVLHRTPHRSTSMSSASPATAREYRRASLLARVRLEPWESGVVLPHERTLAKPKDDRLRLTRACAATLSPIMALYDDPGGRDRGDRGEVAQRQATPRVHRRARRGASPLARAGCASPRPRWRRSLRHANSTSPTATIAMRRRWPIATKCASYAQELDPEDAVNFTLMGLTALEDHGLVVLPTHRIVRGLRASAAGPRSSEHTRAVLHQSSH